MAHTWSLEVIFGDVKKMPCECRASVFARQEYLLQASAEDVHGGRETTDAYALSVSTGGRKLKRISLVGC